jgi:hypothetical protein
VGGDLLADERGQAIGLFDLVGQPEQGLVHIGAAGGLAQGAGEEGEGLLGRFQGPLGRLPHAHPQIGAGLGLIDRPQQVAPGRHEALPLAPRPQHRLQQGHGLHRVLAGAHQGLEHLQGGLVLGVALEVAAALADGLGGGFLEAGLGLVAGEHPHATRLGDRLGRRQNPRQIGHFVQAHPAAHALAPHQGVGVDHAPPGPAGDLGPGHGAVLLAVDGDHPRRLGPLPGRLWTRRGPLDPLLLHQLGQPLDRHDGDPGGQLDVLDLGVG